MDTNVLYILLFSAIGALTATTLHEFTRALTSTVLGDTLPKQQKRLTLNPFKHFEPIGFILLIVTGGFGWGKPVETSALYYKNRKRDVLITAVAPNAVNILFGLIFILLGRLLAPHFSLSNRLFNALAIYNVSLAVYNIVPVTPMDGLKLLPNIIPSNKYFSYLRYEKTVQILFLFLLFMGLPQIILSPIANVIIRFFGLLANII